MGRVERKEIQKMSVKKTYSHYILIVLLVILLLSGIMIVDDSFRYMMMIDEPKVFEHKKIEETVHQFYLCGEKIYVDEEEIKETYGYLKDNTETLIKNLIEKSKQFINMINPS